ncbi:MAG: hypothetical protein JJU02_02745 [Cryomorphaceae bacterium]|nr:hypothetical protein [Cryomorphaceae bacterium]
MKKLYILVYLFFISTCVFSQDTDSAWYESRIHYSFKNKKWSGNGQIYYSSDSTIIFRSEAGYGENSNVFYLVRKWYYPNGKIKRKVFVDFRKPTKARIIDKEYSEKGKLISKIKKKAKRTPEQNRYDKVNWEE